MSPADAIKQLARETGFDDCRIAAAGRLAARVLYLLDRADPEGKPPRQ